MGCQQIENPLLPSKSQTINRSRESPQVVCTMRSVPQGIGIDEWPISRIYLCFPAQTFNLL